MKNKIPAHLFNNKGQFVIEGVLLMVVMISFLLFGLKLFRDGNTIENLFGKPWQKIAGMIESGSWEKADAAAKKHPNQRNRYLSWDPNK